MVKGTANDLEAASEFLELLGAKFPTFQTFDDSKPRNPKLTRVLDGSLSEHADELHELNACGAGVFFSVNLTDGDGRKRENIERVRALMLDLDGAPLDPVLACKLKPHIVVETSPGRFQAYWRVKKAFALDKFEDFQRAVAKRFDGDPAVAKLTACARVPGFFHRKGDPFQVKIISSGDHDPFSESEIVAEFPPERYAHKTSGSFVLLRKDAPFDCAREFAIRAYVHEGIQCLHRYHDTFFEWKKSHFSAIDEARIRAEVYEFLHEAKVNKDGKIVPFNPRPQDVNAVLDVLRSGVYLDSKAEPPFWMSPLNHRSASNLIAFQNGLLDLSTRKLEPHSPQFFNIHALPFDYTPNAPEPKRFYRFLHELFPDDEQAERLLQEYMGLLLTSDTSFQKILLILGPKRSGKGTIQHVITELVGKDNVTNPTMGSLSTQFGLAPLINKSVAIVPDARVASSSGKAVELLLSASGEDRLNIDRKNQHHWEGKLSARFVILTNELPKVLDVSGAFASRFLIISLKESFYGREQRNLKDELLQELPGILNWALEGLVRLRKRGYFQAPESSLGAVRQLEDLSSPVMAFVRDCCTLDPNAKTQKQDLYERYEYWCQVSRQYVMPANTFGKDLTAAYPAQVRASHSNAVNYYRGIKIKEKSGIKPKAKSGSRITRSGAS